MKSLRLFMYFALLCVATMGVSRNVLAQTATPQTQLREVSNVVHPADDSKIVIVMVKQKFPLPKGHYLDSLVAKASGFTNDVCDVITTFDVVMTYERHEYQKNISQRIEIVMDGRTYLGKLRELGVNPLNLNLACIDFDSPLVKHLSSAGALQLASPSLHVLRYSDAEISKIDPGTPFLNNDGKVASVLSARWGGPLEFASAQDIRRFLSWAKENPPSPTLKKRSPA